MLNKAKLAFGFGLTLVWLPLAQVSLADCTPDAPIDDPVIVPLPVSAQSVRLSELFPAPSDGEEFIEVEVLDDGGGNLNGWALQDASGKRFTFDSGVMDTEADRYFSVTQSISKLALNNDGDSVDLLDPSGVVVDHQEYIKPVSDQSWSRFDSGWQWTTVTPGAENVEPAPVQAEPSDDSSDAAPDDGVETEPTVEPTPQPDETPARPVVTALKLNELLPNPEGDDATDEWIELVNEGEEGTVLGWSVTDGTSTYELPDEVLEQGEYVLVSIQDSKINLNNTGDTVYLVGPDQQIAQGVEYGAAASGQSFARFGDAWSWTDTVTAGAANVAPVATPENSDSGNTNSDSAPDDSTADSPDQSTLNLATARALTKGSLVTVQGVAEVEPGPLGDQVIYIQDDSGGMQIYSYHKDFPTDVVRGSLVSVTGVMSSAYGEARVNADEGGVSVVAQQDEVMPKTVSSVDASQIGTLVMVSGTVSSKTSSRLTLDSGIEVYIKSSSSISLSGISVGTQVQVVGIVNQDSTTLRVVPREQEDVMVTTVVAPDPVTGAVPAAAAGISPVGVGQALGSGNSQVPNSNPGWLVIGLAIGVVVLGSLRHWWKKQQEHKRMFSAPLAQPVKTR